MDFMGLSTSFHSEKKFSLSVFGVSCCKTRVLQRVSCPCGCACVSLCRGWPGKKVGETFGSYGKRLYLCTRFREARPCVAVAERGR